MWFEIPNRLERFNQTTSTTIKFFEECQFYQDIKLLQAPNTFSSLKFQKVSANFRILNHLNFINVYLQTPGRRRHQKISSSNFIDRHRWICSTETRTMQTTNHSVYFVKFVHNLVSHLVAGIWWERFSQKWILPPSMDRNIWVCEYSLPTL